MEIFKKVFSKRTVEILALCSLSGAIPFYLIAYNLGRLLKIPLDPMVYTHIAIGMTTIGFVLINIVAWYDRRMEKNNS